MDKTTATLVVGALFLVAVIVFAFKFPGGVTAMVSFLGFKGKVKGDAPSRNSIQEGIKAEDIISRTKGVTLINERGALDAKKIEAHGEVRLENKNPPGSPPR